MHSINKALAYIESHLNEDIDLKSIALASAISPFYLCKVFAQATGYSLGQYLKLRRLTEASRLLLQSNKSIMEIALDVGYNSHSAFCRCCKAEFGITPKELRKSVCIKKSSFLQPIIWSPNMNISVPTPREGNNLTLNLIGMCHRFKGVEDIDKTIHTMLPEFWERVQEIEQPVTPGYLQFIHNAQSETVFEFLVGITVDKDVNIPEKMECYNICFECYLAFPFQLTSDMLKNFIMAIFSDWFPANAGVYTVASGEHVQWFCNESTKHPSFGEKFDFESWSLNINSKVDVKKEIQGEIWIPVIRR